MPDPLGVLVPGINPYHYTYNNPINLNDPTGLWPKCVDDWLKKRQRKRSQNGKSTKSSRTLKRKRRRAKIFGYPTDALWTRISNPDYRGPAGGLPSGSNIPGVLAVLDPMDDNITLDPIDFGTITDNTRPPDPYVTQQDPPSPTRDDLMGELSIGKQYSVPFKYRSSSIIKQEMDNSNSINILVDELLKDPKLQIIIAGNIWSANPKSNIHSFMEFDNVDEMEVGSAMIRRASNVIDYLISRGVRKSQLGLPDFGKKLEGQSEGQSVTIRIK